MLAELPEVSSCLNRLVLEQLEISEQYLGSAEAFREAVLNSRASNRKEQ